MENNEDIYTEDDIELLEKLKSISMSFQEIYDEEKELVIEKEKE